MKKLLVLLCMAALGAVGQAVDVPVENADFELVDEYNKPVGWSSFRYDQDFWAGSIGDNGVATGKYGAVVGQTVSNFQIQAGYRYTLSFDAAMTDGGGMYVLPILWAIDSEGGSDYLNMKSSLYPEMYIEGLGAGLQNYSIGVYAPTEQDGYEVEINLYIMSYNSDWDSIVYIDNVKLEEWLPTPGDMNFDRIVNIEDFAILSQSWMSCNIMPAEVCNIDGYVLTN